MEDIFRKVAGGIEAVFGGEKHSHTHIGEACHDVHPHLHRENRYQSFAPQSSGHAKWYVDGCSYFWAVSIAIEQARQSIYILDWWLSPELYLRRPPSRNEQYRLDTMLKAAAERGVKVNIIVYKEVPQALTYHVPSGHDIQADIESGFQNLSLGSFNLSKVSGDALKSLYGTSDDVVLFWAHHEKLCLIDDTIAFMGGLDMCFGRWDTNSHPIADAHPSNLDNIVFPGQDYNNARVYDFEDVDKWENNKLDRTQSSRMGWSDISISLSGPIVNSLNIHFTDRWNYIFSQKYHAKDGEKYQMIQPPPSHAVAPEGHPTEHSIANAYMEAIQNARHFVYIENQFFITATDDKQHPVGNKIGAAMVSRILRAYEEGEDFRIIVLMPAVPAFAGDLESDGALGTRAIMEFQYNSINRGGHSIIQALSKAGVPDPGKYIAFYNLRNFDRINTSATMAQAQQESGVSYEAARREHDDAVESGYDGYSREETSGRLGDQYRRYQEAASHADDQTWDTISSCYMDSGPSLESVSWQGSPESEIDAFVSEELYIHSKVLIADDRLVICGSANLNDRSQLGTHDSEIAVVIEDPTPVESRMNGQPYTASRFAASLRRQLFRKHLGLLPDQRWDRPDRNWTPVTQDPNEYDWGSPADSLVRDPLADNFDRLWRNTARENTEVFSKVFHNVPNDKVRTWKDYKEFFSKYFIIPGSEDKDKKDEDKKKEEAGKVMYGHVVREEFPGGVVEVKEWLGRVRGTLVEMPLDFLIEVDDIAKEGLSLNSFTDELYT
ncbi:putative phospholipase d protein [Phaeoacremonium minimum UCRPA7]|uniref:phospholipase D n=1 Tax=Phaeoacremonium minimum (strain UCR-PA7) TaxID=1286976 RepID=R8BAM7_PHAM7|nr:putative phospholipase d protein [Phaeoacremonium minimum UCRPA7]EON96350.1 putative phospholipase d protein [Phaeoacremonium minimum UCRPA7]